MVSKTTDVSSILAAPAIFCSGGINMDNDKRKYTRKPGFNKKKRYDRKEESKEDVVVYTTKPSGPVPKADWQLKLQAISDCFDLQDKENYKELVEARFEELKHKQK